MSNIYDSLPASGPPPAPSPDTPAKTPNIYDDMPTGAAPVDTGASADFTDDGRNPGVEMIAGKIKDAGAAALNQINQGLNPWSETGRARAARMADPNRSIGDTLADNWQQFKDVGSGLSAIPALVGAPITGVARGTIGSAWDAMNSVLPDVDPRTGFKPMTGDEVADTAMMGLRAGAPGPRPMSPGVPMPAPPAPGPLGVTLSEGQATQSLPLIQREQAALRNSLGAGAKDRADEFSSQQKGQLATARENVGSNLDQFGATIADNPQQAGQVVSQSIQGAKNAAKAGVDQAYDLARSLPGEIHAAAFEGIGPKIKNELTNPTTPGVKPVIIDDGTTPVASKALDYLDRQVANLRIQNKDDPFGQPNPQNIVGINLNGIDQWRKNLSAYREAAWGKDATDGRATSAVLRAFDDQVNSAINNGLFTGDPAAVQAWNDARAAHTDYRSTFTSSGQGDRIGQAIEQITGSKKNPTPLTPNDVADKLYGTSGTNPNTQNVALANRVKSILGDQSPEWSAVKQGLFSRLIESPTVGQEPLSSAQISKRVTDLLTGNGKELADTMFSPAEKQMLQSYGDLHKSLIVPQAGPQWSNNASAFRRVLDRMGLAVGAAVGRIAAPAAPPFVAEGIGAAVGSKVGKIGQWLDARKIAQQMPLVSEQMAKYLKASAAAAKSNSPVSVVGKGFATANLARSLQPFGLTMADLTGVAAQGPGTANAAQDQPNVPGESGQRKNGGKVEKKKAFAHGGRVNPFAINHKPSDAQKEAGNYAKDHVNIHGLKIAIENSKGSMRRGVGPDGSPWQVKMPAHYGYIKGTVGADKDHVDVYLGPHHRAKHVYVIDQNNADTGDFDEHKAFIGFATEPYCTKTFHSAFSDGKGAKRCGKITKMPIDKFKSWLASGKTKKPLAA